MARVGRPVTKKGKAAATHRTASRNEYASLPASGKKARVANRSKEAQRVADNKRSPQPARKAYKKMDAKAVAGIPKGTKCSNCGSTTNVQRHVVKGKFSRYLCAKCNVAAIGKG
jgi:predicted SprT family Zn-dependent metalloprotease